MPKQIVNQLNQMVHIDDVIKSLKMISTAQYKSDGPDAKPHENYEKKYRRESVSQKIAYLFGIILRNGQSGKNRSFVVHNLPALSLNSTCFLKL
jgi:hypothetical protein